MSAVNREETIARSSLSVARSCLSKKCYGRAFANYLLFMKLSPEHKKDVREDFILTMREWSEELEKCGRIDDLFKCYEQACAVFPECENVLNNIGAQLFRLGYVDEAAMYLRKSLQLKPDFLAARENLENICSHLVERWHFRMLNDLGRNKAYKEAIQKAVRDGHENILDIGAGTGILSMFAVEVGADMVLACEKSRAMFEVAQDVITANDLDARIQLICASSTDLVVPEHIPERVSLVITETFDAGLFGEHILSTLLHAWKHLLHSRNVPRSRVIPCSATVYVCAIECESIHKQNRLLYPLMHKIDLSGVDIVCSTGNDEDEPYTTENLSHIRGGYTMLSDPTALVIVNFNDPEEIERLQNPTILQAELANSKPGRLDAIALWFDLNLNEDITVTTSPTTENCWEQAIFPVLPNHFRVMDDKQEVRKNQLFSESHSLHVKFNLSNDCLTLVSSQVADSAYPYQDIDRISHKLVTSRNLFTLERFEIGLLNDLNLNRSFCRILKKLSSEAEEEGRQLSLLDFSSGLSPLALQAALLGYSSITMVNKTEIYAITQKLASLNSIDPGVISLMDKDEISELNISHDVITVPSLVDSCGALSQQVLEDISLLRVTSLKESGVIVPGQVIVCGVCIESDELQANSAVMDNGRTLGYRIAEFINDFQLTTHVDIELSKLSHKKLSEPFQLFTFDLNEERKLTEPPSFIEQNADLDVHIIDSGCLTAIIYWFELELGNGIHVSTIDPQSHWKQAAVMIKTDHVLHERQSLKLKIRLKNSCIDVQVAEEDLETLHVI